MTVVDKVVDRKGTREVATAYLQYLYTPEGQDIAGTELLPADRPEGGGQVRQAVPKVNLFTIDEVFGGWAKAQKTHFADGGVFDQIYTRQVGSACIGLSHKQARIDSFAALARCLGCAPSSAIIASLLPWTARTPPAAAARCC